MSDETLQLLQQACRQGYLDERVQARRVHRLMIAAGLRTFCIDGLHFERVGSGLQLSRMPVDPANEPQPLRFIHLQAPVSA